MSRAPIVGQISWLNFTVVMVLVTAVLLVCNRFFGQYGVFIAIGIMLFFIFFLRYTVGGEHAAAIAHVKRGEFDKAILRYENSLAFFTRHAWVDTFRAVTMLSASAMTYREMAMLGMAYCYAQIGDGKSAREYYERCLREYPHNVMAAGALRLMDAAKERS